MTGETIRVAVVDDHPVFRLGMSALLASTAGLEVVGEAADADAALRVADQHLPDVIIMDLHLGGRSGWRRPGRSWPGTRGSGCWW